MQEELSILIDVIDKYSTSMTEGDYLKACGAMKKIHRIHTPRPSSMDYGTGFSHAEKVQEVENDILATLHHLHSNHVPSKLTDGVLTDAVHYCARIHMCHPGDVLGRFRAYDVFREYLKYKMDVNSFWREKLDRLGRMRQVLLTGGR